MIPRRKILALFLYGSYLRRRSLYLPFLVDLVEGGSGRGVGWRDRRLRDHLHLNLLTILEQFVVGVEQKFLLHLVHFPGGRGRALRAQEVVRVLASPVAVGLGGQGLLQALLLLQDLGDHRDVLVAGIWWRRVRLLPAEREEHEDKDDTDVDEDDEGEEAVADGGHGTLLVPGRGCNHVGVGVVDGRAWI